MENIYKQNGFENRQAYLESLADDYGLPLQTVMMAAELLGPEEDFDGLVVEIDDISQFGGYDI